MTLANVVDLRTTDATGAANGALFFQSASQAAGTGSYDPFLSLVNSPTEQGFNTDYRSGGLAPLDATSDATFTHSLMVGELQTVNVGGADYYAFNLNIDEPTSGPQRYLSLDELKLYTASTGDLADLSTATVRWNMDQGMNSTVYLDGSTTSSGSGVSAMQVLIPKSALTGVDPSNYLYLYSKFGATGGMAADTTSSASVGSEQWSALTTSTPITVPEPSTLGLLASGLVGLLGAGLRRFRRG